MFFPSLHCSIPWSLAIGIQIDPILQSFCGPLQSCKWLQIPRNLLEVHQAHTQFTKKIHLILISLSSQIVKLIMIPVIAKSIFNDGYKKSYHPLIFVQLSAGNLLKLS